MEKPVKYICKLEHRNEELTIRTTHVTSYEKCRDDEDNEGSEGKKTDDDESCRESGLKPCTLLKNIFAIDSENEKKQVQPSSEDLRKVEGIVLKDEALENHGQSGFQEITNLSMNVASTDGYKTAAKETEDEVVPSGGQDEVKAKVKIPLNDNNKLSSEETDLAENEKTEVTEPKLSAGGSDELSNQSREILEEKKDSTSTQGEENENTERECSSVPSASNNPPAKSLGKSVERSRTPEIDESIAVEVLSTGLFSGAPGFSQYCNPIYTSARQRYEAMRSPSYRDHPSYTQSSLLKDKQEVVRQSSFSNGEPFLDVEGFEPNLQDKTPSPNRLKGRYIVSWVSSSISETQQCHSSLEQENVISSTSNHNVSAQTSNSHVGKTPSDIASPDDQDRYEKARISKNDSYTEETVNKTRTIRDDVDDFEAWQVETKTRKRKKVGLRNASFSREDKMTRRKHGQAVSSDNHKATSWDTKTSTGLQDGVRNSQSNNENTRLVHSATTTVTKPSKPTVTWQSLMAAGRYQLPELMIPGYDQFLMKTKEYELATNVNLEKVQYCVVSKWLTDFVSS